MIARAADRLNRLLRRLQIPGWLRAAFGLGSLTLMLWLVLAHANATWTDVSTTWQSANLALLALAGMVWVIAFFYMSTLWVFLLSTLGGHLDFRTALKIYGASLLPRYVPGQWWGYAGRIILCQRRLVPPSVTSLSILLETGLLAGGACLAAVVPNLTAAWVFPLLGVLAVVSALSIGRSLGSSAQISRPAPRRLSQFGRWYLLIAGYALFWLLYGVCHALVVLAVKEAVPPEYLLQVVPVAAAAWLAGFVVILTPAGLGVREGVLIISLQPLLGPTSAVFAAVLARLVGALAEIVYCGVVIFLLPHVTGDERVETGEMH
jgi:uncharacterized membrane protein YbhN (UPF0104 family)